MRTTLPTRSRWRYGLILVVVCLAVVVAAAAGWRFARKSASASNGPVIVISIDSLRADRLSIYGNPHARTPAIDALARDGVVFDRAYAHSPQTLPSHVTLLSGQLPIHHAVRTDEDALSPQTQLLPRMMKMLGYRSGAALSEPRLTSVCPAFDFCDQPPASRQSEALRPDRQTLAAARKWIGSLASPRFLAFVQMSDVVRARQAEAAGAPPPADLYEEAVKATDSEVGEFVKWLKAQGLYDRATMVLLASHGEGLGDHGEQGHGLFLYDGTMRVPLIVKLPHGANRGDRVTSIAQLVDLPATVLDLLDTSMPATTDGRSLRRLAMGKAATEPDPAVYAESVAAHRAFGWAPLESLTDTQYRYIRAPREELYDLREDPGETRDLAVARPNVVSAMRETLQRLAGPAGAAVPSDSSRASGADPKDKVVAYEKLQLARTLSSSGRVKDAISGYRAFLAAEPACTAVWLELATFLERAAMFSDAADAYARVLKLDSENARAWLGAGYTLLRSGKADAARQHARRAAALAPAGGHELLARIAVEANDWTEAVREAELANQAEPALGLPAMVRGLQLYRASNYEDALPLLQQAASARGERPGAMSDLGGCLAETLVRLARYPEAEAAFKEQVARFPYSPEPRISLAMLYHSQHRDNDTEQVIEELLRTIATPEAYGAVARVWTIFGEKDRADAARAEGRLKFGREVPVGRQR